MLSTRNVYFSMELHYLIAKSSFTQIIMIQSMWMVMTDTHFNTLPSPKIKSAKCRKKLNLDLEQRVNCINHNCFYLGHDMKIVWMSSQILSKNMMNNIEIFQSFIDRFMPWTCTSVPININCCNTRANKLVICATPVGYRVLRWQNIPFQISNEYLIVSTCAKSVWNIYAYDSAGWSWKSNFIKLVWSENFVKIPQWTELVRDIDKTFSTVNRHVDGTLVNVKWFLMNAGIPIN